MGGGPEPHPAPRGAASWGDPKAALDQLLKKVSRGDRLISLLGAPHGPSLGDYGAECLGEALEDRECIKGGVESLLKLQLRNHNVTDKGAFKLASALGGPAGDELQVLDLGGNQIGDQGACELAKALLIPNGVLRTLDLSKNSVGDAGAMELAKVVESHQDLEELVLSSNTINLKGAGALAEAVAGHRGLKALALDGNPFGTIGARAFAECLQGGNLVDLSLSSCRINDVGAQALADGLLRHPSTRTIRLGSNFITNVGAEHFAAVLSQSPGLRHLGMELNDIDDGGLLCLVKALVRLERDNIVCDLRGSKSKRFAESSLTNLTIAARTIRSMSRRGFKAGALLKMSQELTNMGVFSEDDTVHNVVEKLNEELERMGCCFAEFLCQPQAEYYVIHTWKSRFLDLVRGIASHASGNPWPSLDPNHESYSHNPACLDKVYFIDVLCVNQFKKHPLGDPRCENDKFDLVLEEMSSRGCKALLTVDQDYEVLQRTWCLTEAHHSFKYGMTMNVSFSLMRPFWRRRKGSRLKNAEVSKPEEGRLLLEELRVRGVGLERFDAEVTARLEEQIAARYIELFPRLPEDRQQELDWFKQQDDAREDMADAARNQDAAALRVAVQAGIEARVEESTLQPKQHLLAFLELQVASVCVDIEKIPEILTILTAAREYRVDMEAPELMGKAEDQLAELKRRARRKAAEEEMLRRQMRGDIPGLRAAVEEAIAAECSPDPVYKAKRKLAELELDKAVKEASKEVEGKAQVLASAILLAREVRLPPIIRDKARAKLKELDVAEWAASIVEELAAECREADSGYLSQAITMAEKADMGPDYAQALIDAKRCLAELNLAAAVKASSPSNLDELREALKEAVAAGASEERTVSARRRLLEIELTEVMKAGLDVEVEKLRRLLDRAGAVQVEEGLVKKGRKLLAEVDLAVAMRRKRAEPLRTAVNSAIQWNVKESVVKPGKILLAELDLTAAAETDDVAELQRAIAVAAELHLPASTMAPASTRLASVRLALALAQDNIGQLELALQVAIDNNVAKEEIRASQQRLAILKLTAAAKGILSTAEEVLELMQDAREVGIEREHACREAGRRRLLKLAPEAYRDWLAQELHDAVEVASASLTTSESALRCVYEDALKAKVQEEDEAIVTAARKRLLEFKVKAVAIDGNYEEVGALLQEALKEKLDQASADDEQRLPEERRSALLQALRDRFAVVEAETRVVRAEAALEAALNGNDIRKLKLAIAEAQQAGVAAEIVEAAKARCE